MIQNEIAQKYSQALFEVGKASGELLRFKEDLELVIASLKQAENLQKVIFHPRVLASDKKTILKKVFGDNLSEKVYNLLYLLIDKRRENHLEFIYRDFVSLVNKEENILEVEVTSVIPLSQTLKNKLTARLHKIFTNDEIIIREKIDTGIIGGLVLKVGDKVVDGSIRYSLNSLKEKIMQIPVSETGV